MLELTMASKEHMPPPLHTVMDGGHEHEEYRFVLHSLRKLGEKIVHAHYIKW